ncbi:MAG: hypothetical protein V4617_10835 [Gemmatimonadota bacterium]
MGQLLLLGCMISVASTASAQSVAIVLTPIPPVGPMMVNDGQRPPNTRDFPTTKQFASFNTSRALLDQRKKLKLTEEQVNALTALEAVITARNAELVASYDSVFRVYKNSDESIRVARMTAVDVSTLATQRTSVMVTPIKRAMWIASQELIVRHNADVADALALLDDSRRDAAVKLLNAHTREMLTVLPQPPTPG